MMNNKYCCNKLKVDFEPVLEFFNVAPTGNLFADVTALARAMEETKIDEKLTRFFFDYYDKNANGMLCYYYYKRLY
jgi:hypothetical protein